MVRRAPERNGRPGGGVLLISAIAIAACSSPKAERSPDARTPEPRSVVLFVSDALRACSLHLHGYPIATTPRLDEFARQATVFSRHYAHSPSTPGSISQLMTGRLMSPWLLETRPVVTEARRPPRDMMVLPDLLRQAGLRTGLVTTHHAFFEGARLLEHFDFSVVLDPPHGLAYGNVEALSAPVESFLESVAREEAPFFLYIHAMDTHSPYQGWRMPPPPELPKARRYAAYDARIKDVDDWFGRLLDRLKRLNLDDSTIVIFTSDHGEDHREEGHQSWNAHHGFTLRASQLHVPMVVRVPGGKRAGWVHEGATGHFDLAPTLLSLVTGSSLPARFRVDGRDLSRLWDEGGETVAPDRPIPVYNRRYWGFFIDEHLVRFDAWGGELAEFVFEASDLNYPHPVQVEVKDAEAGARLVERRRQALSEYLAFPPARLQDRERVGVPTWIEADEETSPTYILDPLDNRWTARTWMSLECSPAETCPPLELGMPWVPGTYRLSVRLSRKSHTSYAQHFTLEVGGEEGEVERVDVRPGQGTVVPVGTYTVGGFLHLRLSKPKGGVALDGLEIERVGGEESQPRERADREERLRALGYLE